MGRFVDNSVRNSVRAYGDVGRRRCRAVAAPHEPAPLSPPPGRGDRAAAPDGAHPLLSLPSSHATIVCHHSLAPARSLSPALAHSIAQSLARLQLARSLAARSLARPLPSSMSSLFLLPPSPPILSARPTRCVVRYNPTSPDTQNERALASCVLRGAAGA